MKKNIKITIWIILLIIIWVGWKYYYNYYNNQKVLAQEEQENIKIDEYNFEQLEKVKNILKNLKRTDTKFSSLKEFNSIYNSNIEPIKNCYYIKNYENKERVLYSFWFRLESNKYIQKYWDKNYMYPKYDLPIYKICVWECVDKNKIKFYKTIST